jgi:hypothetical protein
LRGWRLTCRTIQNRTSQSIKCCRPYDTHEELGLLRLLSRASIVDGLSVKLGTPRSFYGVGMTRE